MSKNKKKEMEESDTKVRFNSGSLKHAVRLWCSFPKQMERAFGPIGKWDVSSVFDMEELFINADHFNEDISG